MKNQNVTVELSRFEADVLLSLIRDSERFTNTANIIWDKVNTAFMESLDADDNHYQPDESMDGDFDSAMASAGHGTDEDYGSPGEEYSHLSEG